jgi:hypothetical protein
MRLFVRDKLNDQQRIYLQIVTPTRSDLARQIGSPWFYLENSQYHVHEVIAEPEENNTAAGAVVGGIIGLIGGPLGILIGGAVGGALGNGGDRSERAKVQEFNASNIIV